jgi:hypothetical protein
MRTIERRLALKRRCKEIEETSYNELVEMAIDRALVNAATCIICMTAGGNAVFVIGNEVVEIGLRSCADKEYQQ